MHVPGELDVTGESHFNNVTIGDDCLVTGDVDIYGTMEIGGNLKCEGVVDFNDNVSILNLDVSGNTQLNDLNANGDSLLKGNVTIGTTTFVKDMKVFGDITATDEIFATNQITTQSVNATNVVNSNLYRYSYTSLPTLTSNDSGFTYSSYFGTSLTTSSNNFGTINSLPIGVYIVVAQMVIFSSTVTTNVIVRVVRGSSVICQTVNVITFGFDYTPTICFVYSNSSVATFHLQAYVSSGTALTNNTLPFGGLNITRIA